MLNTIKQTPKSYLIVLGVILMQLAFFLEWNSARVFKKKHPNCSVTIQSMQTESKTIER